MTRKTQLFVCLLASLCASVSSAQEAYVYISTTKGTYAYDAASTGKLTPIKGSPFQTIGTMVGTNGKYLVALSAVFTPASLLSYEVLSSGAIGKLVSSIKTNLYAGSQCGPEEGGGYTQAELDHTGENVYVLLSDYDFVCDGIQTYGISKTGKLTFKGDTEFNEGDQNTSVSLPTLSGNGKFGYGWVTSGYDESSCAPYPIGFRSISGEVLESDTDIQITTPAPPPAYDDWQSLSILTDDPTDHVVIAMLGSSTQDCGGAYGVTDYGPVQLASFTPDSQGNLTTTNTYKNMPVIEGYQGADTNSPLPTSMKLNPAGTILAVAIDTGVQLFHFNGAKPITPFSGLIGVTGSIRQMGWDTDNHLYALNTSGKMHVYGATSKAVTELSGSRTVVPLGPFVIRSK